MGSYYFLAAQLPGLTYGINPPMSSEEFKQKARSFLDENEAALLDLLELNVLSEATASAGDAGSGSEFIDNWRQWERTLRLNLARLRAIKTKREGAALSEAPVLPSDAAAAAGRAMGAAENPLETEIALDRSRWDAIESLAGFNYFHVNTIYAYLLKLKLLERRAVFEKTEEGFTQYKALYTSILSGAERNAESGMALEGEI